MTAPLALRGAFAIALAGLWATALADEAAVRATLARVFPQGKLQGIEPTPVAGLFEVAVDGRIYYVTADGRYILGGPLIDVEKQANLTQARQDRLDAIAWDSLPLDLAIRRVKGSGARRIAIFEDPDCPYCKQLEQTLDGMDDLTLYVLLYPIDSLHPAATAKAKAVWCAKDRAAAWETAVREGVVPKAEAACETPIAKIADFAKQHRIEGTPTLVLADGRRLVGALPRAELEQQLRAAASHGGPR